MSLSLVSEVPVMVLEDGLPSGRYLDETEIMRKTQKKSIGKLKSY